MKILIYTRPKSEGFFREVVNEIFDSPEITTYSDYNRIADYWAGKYIYDDKYDHPNERFEEEASDILPRCRTLRRMPRDLAYSLARKYWNGMEEFFSEHNFDYLFTVPVDCYSLDILCRVAERKHVHIVSIIGSVFAGNARITLRGEYNKVREDVPEEDIQKYIDRMTQVSYLSPSEVKNVQKNHKSIYKFYARRSLIEYGYYPLMKVIDNDPWNYHYNIFEIKGIPLKKRFDATFESKFKHLDEIHFDPAKTIYYPMHLIPEATTDYWCPDIRVANYNQFILDMIHNADPGITLIIKEHPAMYGRRLLDFYDQLNMFPNVILLHPMDRSNNLLLEVENVVVDNGTVGIEALLRRKRVICLSDNYYQNFHPNAFMCERITMESLNQPLQEYSNYAFMKSMLQGCFPSDFANSNNGIPNSNPHQAALGIRTYLEINNLPMK